jgi:hypothetical protein
MYYIIANIVTLRYDNVQAVLELHCPNMHEDYFFKWLKIRNSYLEYLDYFEKCKQVLTDTGFQWIQKKT